MSTRSYARSCKYPVNSPAACDVSHPLRLNSVLVAPAGDLGLAERYYIYNNLGEGSWGHVYDAYIARNYENVAIKVIPAMYLQGGDELRIEQRILRMATEAGASYLPHLLHSWSDQDYVYFVMVHFLPLLVHDEYF